MFNKFLNRAKTLFDQGEKALTKAIGRSSFNRLVSAGYLIAQADGDFDQDERTALAKILNKELPQFELSDILAVIKDCDDKVSFDKTLGTTEILDLIGGADKEDGELIMRVCCFIGQSDGDFDRDEKLVARDIAMRLGLPPSRYGL